MIQLGFERKEVAVGGAQQVRDSHAIDRHHPARPGVYVACAEEQGGDGPQTGAARRQCIQLWCILHPLHEKKGGWGRSGE